MLVDIIIPTYENEDYTVACLESIKRSTEEGSYQIIWVDNASKNREKVEATIKDMSHIAIRMKTNTGFVPAINAGIKASSAPVICLLNNDTQVTKGWLDKLLKHLFLRKSVGIVGPMGQPGSGSPESLERLQGIHRLPRWQNKVESYNRLLEERFNGVNIPANGFVAFSCALIKREVIEGLIELYPEKFKDGLDSNYGIGFWDDVDYGHYAKRSGFELLTALDTLIYHKGRTTFRIIEAEGVDTQKVHKENFEYYMAQRKGAKMLTSKNAGTVNHAKLVRMGGPSITVKLTRSLVLVGQPRFVGDVIELPERKAKELIATGRAVESAAPPEPVVTEPTVEEVKQEPAKAVRTAIKKPARKRGK